MLASRLVLQDVADSTDPEVYIICCSHICNKIS